MEDFFIEVDFVRGNNLPYFQHSMGELFESGEERASKYHLYFLLLQKQLKLSKCDAPFQKSFHLLLDSSEKTTMKPI